MSTRRADESHIDDLEKHLSFQQPTAELASQDLTQLTNSAVSKGMELQRGRLIVRCVRAWGLPAADRHFLRMPASDPYVELILKDDETRTRTKSKRTTVIPKTLNPRWHQEFSWHVKQATSALALHLDVWDFDEDKEDDFLGQASLSLNPEYLQQAATKRQVHDLVLQADDERSHLPPSGKVRVEILWEPQHVAIRGSGGQLTLWSMLNQPPVLRVAALAANGLAGLLQVVAMDTRWLCTGRVLPGCAEVFVPGTSVCCLMAAAAQLLVFIVHFLGAAGIIYTDQEAWAHMPPNLLRLSELGHGRDDINGERASSNIEVQLLPVIQGGGFNVAVNTSFLPSVPMLAVRVFTWLLQAAAITLSSLALLLSWLEEGKDSFLAEAAYIEAVAVVLVLLSATLFRRADVAQDNMDRWVANHTPTAGKGDAVSKRNSAMFWNRPSALPDQIEDVLHQTRMQMERQRELFEEGLQRFHEQVQTKLSQGPTKMQQNLRNLQEAAQPLLSNLARVSVQSGGGREQAAGDADEESAASASRAGRPARGGRSRERDPTGLDIPSPPQVPDFAQEAPRHPSGGAEPGVSSAAAEDAAMFRDDSLVRFQRENGRQSQRMFCSC